MFNKIKKNLSYWIIGLIAFIITLLFIIFVLTDVSVYWTLLALIILIPVGYYVNHILTKKE